VNTLNLVGPKTSGIPSVPAKPVPGIEERLHLQKFDSDVQLKIMECCQKEDAARRRAPFVFGQARINFGVDNPEGQPTPKKPLPVLPPRQMGYQSAPL